MGRVSDGLRISQDSLHVAAQILIALIGAILLGASLLAAVGLIPWPEISLQFGGAAVPMAGMWLQLGLSTLAGAVVLLGMGLWLKPWRKA